jgi:hypothetical protein
MTIITPKPSVIFSTTSSSADDSSIRSGYDCNSNGNINGNANSNVDIDGNIGERGKFDEQEQQIGLDVDVDDDDEADDQEIENIVTHVYYDEQKATLFSSTTTTSSSTTTETTQMQMQMQMKMKMKMQIIIKNDEYKSSRYYLVLLSKRILQLFMIHFFVYISITVYYQSTNRLSVPSSPRIILTVGNNGLVSSLSSSLSSSSSPPPATSLTSSTTNTNIDTTISNDINNNINININDKDCYYVPGGGFSGYWFLLGRLQNMKHQNMNDKKFVCYSSGCLGVIATLLMNTDNNNNGKNNNNVDSIYDMARTIQIEWNEGRLHQYQVVESFIDELLSPVLDNNEQQHQHQQQQQQQQHEEFLETIRNNLYIITSTYDDNSIIPKAIIQQPSNIHELKYMLLQTAWIPFVTGSSWTYKNHMDGAFSTFQHPICNTNIELILPKIAQMTSTESAETKTKTKPSITMMEALKLWTNILNVNLKKDDVDILWKMGFDYGV